MAKVAISNKKGMILQEPSVPERKADNVLAPSKHSREARRATSPSINTDKSLKDVKLPTQSVNQRPSVLAIHHGAGVNKKQKSGRKLSSRARRRAELNQDKAVAISERTENKIAKSKGSSRNIQTRRKDWDEINKMVPQPEKSNGKPEDNDEEDDKAQAAVPVLDDEMDEAEEATPVATAAGDSVQAAMDEDDDIL